MSQKIRNYESRTKATKANENDVEEFVSSQGKKQFGLSSTNSNKTFLSNSQQQNLKSQSGGLRDDLFKNNYTNEKQKLQKPASTIPQKRTESAVGLVHYSESKKQNVKKVEQTYRHLETEIEWAPEGLDLDFSPFGNSPVESSYEKTSSMFDDDMEQDVFKPTERSFALMKEVEESVSTLQESAVEEEPEQEIEHDTSRVEYGPPREVEIPFKPHESCILDFSDFSGYADLDGYELARLFDRDGLDFVFDDIDALELFEFEPIDYDALVFDYEFSDLNEIEMYSEDDLDIPFSDYKFDVDHFIQCNPDTSIAAI